MEIGELKLKGIYEITLKPLTDGRGFFMRTYDDKIFEKAGLKYKWVQENHSYTLKQGTIHGLHFQLPPFPETKLIRCIRGKIFDVFVDLRKDSPTFGHWDSTELCEDINKMILLPRGFAHGYYTLTKDCHLLYKHDNYFNRAYYSGIIWNDIEIKINWPNQDVIISEKDKNLMTFAKFKVSYGGF